MLPEGESREMAFDQGLLRPHVVAGDLVLQ